MKIAVCLKQVPARDWQPRANAAGTGIEDRDATFELNEPDAYALEAALQLRDTHGGELVAYAVGPDRVTHVLREALAKGADRAVHVAVPDTASGDGLAAAAALAFALRDDPADLVLTGLQSDDDGSAQTGVALAAHLGLPSATIVMAVEVVDATVRVKRELEGGWFQWVTVPMPAVLTIQSGSHPLRYATLKGIMAAKKKEIGRLQAPPPPPARVRTVAIAPPTRLRQTEMLTGTPSEMAHLLVERLRASGRIPS